MVSSEYDRKIRVLRLFTALYGIHYFLSSLYPRSFPDIGFIRFLWKQYLNCYGQVRQIRRKLTKLTKLSSFLMLARFALGLSKNICSMHYCSSVCVVFKLPTIYTYQNCFSSVILRTLNTLNDKHWWCFSILFSVISIKISLIILC